MIAPRQWVQRLSSELEQQVTDGSPIDTDECRMIFQYEIGVLSVWIGDFRFGISPLEE